MTPTKAHYEGDTYVLDDWTWDRIAFVPKGAFPNAGVKSTCVDDPRLCGFIPEKPYGFYGAVAAALNSEPRRYNPMQATIGDLVGKNINDSRMQISASLPWRPFDPKQPTVGNLVGKKLGESQETAEAAATVNGNGTSRFDPMQPTIGSLVGVRLGASQTTAEVAATVNENENSSAHFDPKKPTVGDLTHLKSVHGHGHTSMGTISVEPGDIAVHPSRVKEVSR
jgi:hypothetical protein